MFLKPLLAKLSLPTLRPSVDPRPLNPQPMKAGVRFESAAHVMGRRSSVISAILWGGLSIAGTVGCGVEPDTLNSIREVAERVSSVSSSGGVEADLLSMGESVDGDASQYTVSFTPPFPERKNPFRYPDETETDETPVISTSVTEISVLGFADLPGRPVQGDQAATESTKRVLLRTNAGVESLGVGDRVGAVTIIRIENPIVELKMGSLVWTATMFDK